MDVIVILYYQCLRRVQRNGCDSDTILSVFETCAEEWIVIVILYCQCLRRVQRNVRDSDNVLSVFGTCAEECKG